MKLTEINGSDAEKQAKPNFTVVELKLTEDGSHTLYVAGIDETYHSIHGAVQEAEHIFMDAALRICNQSNLTVFEVGFGTGLNAFLTLIESINHSLKVHYITLEKFPVAMADVDALNYPDRIAPDKKILFEALHRSEWNVPVLITPDFILEKRQADFTEFQHAGSRYDLVFFDAFSPEKQPEMWTQTGFEKIYEHCHSGAMLTTYCAKGQVRRNLQAAGFVVERLPGPPGKREMLRARKQT